MHNNHQRIWSKYQRCSRRNPPNHRQRPTHPKESPGGKGGTGQRQGSMQVLPQGGVWLRTKMQKRPPSRHTAGERRSHPQKAQVPIQPPHNIQAQNPYQTLVLQTPKITKTRFTQQTLIAPTPRITQTQHIIRPPGIIQTQLQKISQKGNHNKIRPPLGKSEQPWTENNNPKLETQTHPKNQDPSLQEKECYLQKHKQKMPNEKQNKEDLQKY